MTDLEGKDNTPKKRRRKKKHGMPDPDSILEVRHVTSPKGTVYRILRTKEQDPYDSTGDHNLGEGEPS